MRQAGNLNNPASNQAVPPSTIVTNRAKTGLAIVAGALMLLWPALYSHFPLLTPDSLSYIAHGQSIFDAIRHPFGPAIADTRAEFFELGLLFLHWNRWAWPIVVFHALLSSWILWVTIRLFGHTASRKLFLLIVAILSVATGIAWFVSTATADAAGPPCYLALLLLVFRWESVKTPERWVLAAVAWWGMEAHTTHWMVAGGLCAFLGILTLFPRRVLAGRRRFVAVAASLVLFAIVSQVVFHRLLYKRFTLNGVQVPYLMARIIPDGAGLMYLKAHCPELKWVLCQRLDMMPVTDTVFLWDEHGVWGPASESERKELKREENPLVMGAVREFPRLAAIGAARNFRLQLLSIGSWESSVPAPRWVLENAPILLKGQNGFARSKAATGTLYKTALTFGLADDTLCASSELSLLLLIPLAWKRGKNTVFGFAMAVVGVLLMNAAVCGIFSGAYPRYQGRVVWLAPLTVILIGLELFQLRPAGELAAAGEEGV